MIYIAVPYSHKDRKVRHDRFFAVTQYAAMLMSSGKSVFSPITHTHLISVVGGCEAKPFEFYEEADLKILSVCDELHVLCLPGWRKSRGVKAEIKAAQKYGIAVRLVEL